ncbi:hypothetical protein B0J13DRAFT_461720 [Dactylonectria estremocensis]|uniref:V-type proton ATPase proteolipid subunit n=1 Tax=Dactylonectria estremocensis TaxID=1079267 RepID=A0A9P9I9B4_9HYPO|nr:hypothetical protein B0J13DRAFT_461720 [Dactylonectria estremocensis]
MDESELVPHFAPFISIGGIAAAMVFTISAAYRTIKSDAAITSVSTFRPDLVMKSLIPVVMSGIIAIYSLIIAVLIAKDLKPPSGGQHYSLFTYVLPSIYPYGVAISMTGLAASYYIGIVGDARVRAFTQQSRVFISMVLILIFREVLELYGFLIIALILNTKTKG